MPPLPLVTVIIPAFNAEEYIAEAIGSALGQTYANLEVLVIDDGSGDGTRRIAESLARVDDRVSVLHQQNQGVAAARNLGIERARGEFVAPLDADDVWYPEKIEKQMHRMGASSESTGLVYTWFIHIDPHGNSLGDGRNPALEGFVYEALALNCFVGCASVPLIRRSVLERVGGYRCDLRAAGAQGCEDWELYLRIAADYEFRVVPSYLVGYRKHPDQMSKVRESMNLSRRLVLERIENGGKPVSARILRWAKGKRYTHDLWTALHRRRFGTALKLSAEGLRWDPLSLVAFYETFLMTWLVQRLPPSVRNAVSFEALVDSYGLLMARRWSWVCRRHAAGDRR
jgi:glycosyltransferase involved in cell wall biosynthesis